jgi:hypothetical protein
MAQLTAAVGTPTVNLKLISLDTSKTKTRRQGEKLKGLKGIGTHFFWLGIVASTHLDNFDRKIAMFLIK